MRMVSADGLSFSSADGKCGSLEFGDERLGPIRHTSQAGSNLNCDSAVQRFTVKGP